MDVVAWGLTGLVAVQIVLLRLAPYYWLGADRDLVWNLIPLGALAMFVGSRWRSRWAALLPVGVYFLSDLLLIAPLAQLGWPAFSWGTPMIYASLAVYFFLGRLVPRDRFAPGLALLAAVLGTAQFFLISNFLVWARNVGDLYTRDLSGLITCYTAALPFIRNTLLADTVYGVGLFVVYWAVLLVLSESRSESHQELPV